MQDDLPYERIEKETRNNTLWLPNPTIYCNNDNLSSNLPLSSLQQNGTNHHNNTLTTRIVNIWNAIKQFYMPEYYHLLAQPVVSTNSFHLHLFIFIIFIINLLIVDNYTILEFVYYCQLLCLLSIVSYSTLHTSISQLNYYYFYSQQKRFLINYILILIIVDNFFAVQKSIST